MHVMIFPSIQQFPCHPPGVTGFLSIPALRKGEQRAKTCHLARFVIISNCINEAHKIWDWNLFLSKTSNLIFYVIKKYQNISTPPTLLDIISGSNLKVPLVENFL